VATSELNRNGSLSAHFQFNDKHRPMHGCELGGGGEVDGPIQQTFIVWFAMYSAAVLSVVTAAECAESGIVYPTDSNRVSVKYMSSMQYNSQNCIVNCFANMFMQVLGCVPLRYTMLNTECE
jgi:hypothetical protein